MIAFMKVSFIVLRFIYCVIVLLLNTKMKMFLLCVCVLQGICVLRYMMTCKIWPEEIICINMQFCYRLIPSSVSTGSRAANCRTNHVLQAGSQSLKARLSVWLCHCFSAISQSCVHGELAN